VKHHHRYHRSRQYASRTSPLTVVWRLSFDGCSFYVRYVIRVR